MTCDVSFTRIGNSPGLLQAGAVVNSTVNLIPFEHSHRQCVAVFAIVVQFDLQYGWHRHIGADAYFIGGAAVKTFDRMFRRACVLQS